MSVFGLGVGWWVDETKGTTDWDILHTAAADIHGDLGTCAYIRHRVQKDDLVWTRDTQGNYLARVLSGWEYFTTEESRESGIDIGNVFRVTFERLTINEVAGTVVACFRPSRTIQAIYDPMAVAYSKFPWKLRAGDAVMKGVRISLAKLTWGFHLTAQAFSNAA